MNGGWRRPLRIAAELAVGFGLLILLDRVLGTGGAFARVQPNPLWLPVLVMALAYGTLPALVAAGIASALWLGLAPHDAGRGDYLDHLFDLSVPPLLWFVAAVAIGEVTMLRTGRHARMARRADMGWRNVARLSEAFHRLVRTNRALETEVATDARTLGHIVATASRLGAGDPAERRAALVRLIACAARTEDFTCYRFAGEGARAWLRGATAGGRPATLPDALALLARRRHAPIHVGRPADRAALEGIGVIAIPLVLTDSARIAGCLVIHHLPFHALSAHALAEMAEIGGWLTPLIAAPEPTAATGGVRSAGRVA